VALAVSFLYLPQPRANVESRFNHGVESSLWLAERRRKTEKLLATHLARSIENNLADVLGGRTSDMKYGLSSP
jgi:hypothetical protein